KLDQKESFVMRRTGRKWIYGILGTFFALLLVVHLLVVFLASRSHRWYDRVEEIDLSLTRPLLTQAEIEPDNAYYYLLQMVDAFDRDNAEAFRKEIYDFLPTGLATNDFPETERWIAAHTNLFVLWDKAAAAPFAQAPRSRRFPDGYRWVPPVSAVLYATPLLLDRAAQAGDWDEFERICFNALRVADALSRGGAEANTCAGLSRMDRTLVFMRRAVFHNNPPVPVVRRWLKRVTEFEAGLEAPDVIWRDAYHELDDVLKAVYRDPAALKGLSEWTTPSSWDAVPGPVKKVLWRWAGSHYERSREHLEAVLSRSAFACLQPYDTRNHQLYEWHDTSGMDDLFVYLGNACNDPVGRTMVKWYKYKPDLEMVNEIQRRCRAGLRATRLMFAIRIYTLEHEGALPESLELLTPDLLPEIPRDPFSKTGEPIQWVRDREPWFVYSVGPDGEDQKGASNYWFRSLAVGGTDILYEINDLEQVQAKRLKREELERGGGKKPREPHRKSRPRKPRKKSGSIVPASP
ncbi:MAG: hypothetical protein AAF492_19740, partial [Verrucomicrobiota bacterium]